MVMLATGRHDQLSQVEDATPRNKQAEEQKMLRSMMYNVLVHNNKWTQVNIIAMETCYIA